jgi:hypothetical protein
MDTASDLSFWTRLYDAATAIGVYWLALLLGGTIAGAYAVSAHPKKWWPRSSLAGWLDKSATKVGVFAFILFCSFFYAWFMAFDSVNVENHRLRNEANRLTAPDFSLALNNIIVGDDRPGSVHVLPFLTVSNSGADAAIVASSWHLRVHLPSGKDFWGDPSTITSSETYCIGNVKHRTLESSDQLSLRASEPIARMGYREGVLPFVVRGPTVSEILISELDISMEDVRHKGYTFHFQVPDITNRTGSIFSPSYAHPLPEDGCSK